MIEIIVCDDDISFADILKERVESIVCQLGYDCNVVTYYSGAQLLAAIKYGAVMDILFLDYRMPKLNGANVAAALRKKDHAFKLVFISSYEEKVFTLFDHDMVSFVPKDKVDNLLEPAVNRAVRQLIAERESLETFALVKDKSEKDSIRLSTKSILYFELVQKIITLYTNIDGQSYSLGRISMDDLEERYTHYMFFRLSRSILVNLLFVASYGFDHVVLENGQELHMSYRRKDAFEEKYLPIIHGK